MNIVKLFRTTAYLEGASFLILLFIAMPLKYMYSMPLAVRIVGSFHGAFFVAYCVLLALVWQKLKWDLKTVSLAFISAFLPAGPFIFDRRILAEVDE